MAEINFKFLGDASDLVNATDDAADSLGTAEKSSEDFAKAAKAGLAVAAAAAATATVAIVKMSKAVLDLSAKANQYAKDAKKIGSTAEEIQRVEGAFKLLTKDGVSASRVIQDFGRNLADARDGTGEAAAELDKLGLSAADIANLPIGEQIALVADRFGRLRDSAEQSQVAMSIFGRSGRELVPALAAGGDAVRKAIADIEDAGLISNEAAAQSEALQDSIELLGRTFDSLGREVLVPLIPIFTATSDALRGLIGEMDGSRAGTVIAQLQTALLDLAGPMAGLVHIAGLGIEVFRLQYETMATLVDTALLAGAAFEALVSGDFAKAKDLAGSMGANFSSLGQQILDFGDDSAAAADKVQAFLETIGAAGATSLPSAVSGGSGTGSGTGSGSEGPTTQDLIQLEMEKLLELDAHRAEMAQRESDRQRELHRNRLSDLDSEVSAALNAAAQRQAIETASSSTAVSLLGSVADIAATVGDARVQSAAKGSEAEKRAMRQAWNTQTAFALLQAGINIPLSISQASAAGYPQAIGYMVAAGAASGAAFAGVVAKAAGGPPFHSGGITSVPTGPDEGLLNLRAKEKVAVFNPGASQSMAEQNVHSINRGDHKRSSQTLILQMNDRTVDVQTVEAIRRPDSPLAASIQASRPRKVGSARVF
jgi:hypothetical protein